MTPRDTLSPLRLLWLAAALLTIVAACTPLGGWLDGNVRVFGTRSVRVAVQVADAGFGTRAAARTAGDIGFYRFKLVNVGLATIAAQYQTTATAFTFSTLPDGTYRLKAEAFSAGGVSITAGGEQTSSNTATVASPAVTYSTGSSLAVTLPLLAGTGETLYNHVIVSAGSPPGALTGASVSAAATVAGTFAVGTSPRGIAVDAAGNIWVANNTSNDVTKLDGNGNVLGTFAVAGSPMHLVVDTTGSVWVTKNAGNQIEKLNSAGVSQGTLNVGAAPSAIAIDPTGNVWVANTASNTVHKISPAMTSLAEIAVGTSPRAIAFDRYGNPLIGHGTSNDVRKLDPASGGTLATYPAGGAVQHIVVDAIGYLWLTINAPSGQPRLTAGGSQVGTYTVGTTPMGMVSDGAGRIWTAESGANQVRVRASNGATLALITVGNQPQYLASDNGGFVWVTNMSSNTVMKLKL
jgi:streptogramin lyase